MIASFLLWPEAEGHALALSADILPAFLKKLSMYVLRSKVRLADARATTALIGIAGPNASAVLQASGVAVPQGPMQQTVTPAAAADLEPLRCIRIGEAQFVLAVAVPQAAPLFDACVAAGAIRAGTAAWELTMIRAGLPLIGAATQEEFVAQMLNYDLIGGVSFHKGCYPGQEIVARTQYLGKLKKRLYRLVIPATASATAAAAGADLFAPDFGDQPAGKIVNLAPAPDGGFEALAVLQNSSAEAGEIRLGSAQGPLLQRLDLPYPLPRS
jgi:folate-binding protein YgfZ